MKKTLLSLVLILSLGTQPVYAFEMDEKVQQTQFVSEYSNQVTSTALYLLTTTYTVYQTVSEGVLDMNSAMGFLASVAPNLSEFQEKLNFSDASSFASLMGKSVGDFADDIGMEDWKKGVGDSLNQLKNEADGAIQGAQNKADEAFRTVQDTANKATQSIQDSANKAWDTVAETAGNIKDGISDSVDSVSSKNADSSADRVIIVKNNFGAPQPNKQQAQRFIRSRYYYSTKDGDTYDGKPLLGTSEARKRVLKNRNGYYREVAAMALATAFEGETAVKEDSINRLKSLQSRIKQAETIDDKRALEALITQEKTRQRIIRLNFDIAQLEADIVEELQTIDAEYIIARTAEQVVADTKAIVGTEK
ncbi:MAG: hypothetical protein J6Y03_01090 [Alphaproteobacteria bacterium]|nr:hypothetical protein [Alphaproteobacteria bacterium]